VPDDEEDDTMTATTVPVPSLVGLTVPDATDTGVVAGVVTVGDWSGRPPVAGTVVAQQPVPGTEVEVGTSVRIWIEDADDGGGGGGGGGGRPLLDPVPQPDDPGGAKPLPA
jgi:PASTA domain